MRGLATGGNPSEPGEEGRVSGPVSCAGVPKCFCGFIALKELASAIAAYKIHTFNDIREITASRAPKNKTEVLQQVVVAMSREPSSFAR